MDGKFTIAWCNPEKGGVPEGFKPPAKGAECFVITNDGPSLTALFKGTSHQGVKIIDIGTLARIVLPETPVESHEAANNSPEELERIWNKCSARLDALPRWVLDILSSLCMNMEEDGLTALFSHWAKTTGVPAGGKWCETFHANLRKVERRPLPTLEDCTPVDPAEVALRLGPGGALARLIPGYEPRPGQIKMLVSVVDAFNTGRHLVVEAGTGIGKSLAYLLPAALWARTNDMPVVVSTNTKNLQSQLVEKDLPMVLKVLDGEPAFRERPLAAAVIKGRGNYLCLRRFGQLLEEGIMELMRPELRMAASAIAWAGATPDGDFDSIKSSGAVEPQFLHMLASSAEECQGRGCRHYSRCFIQKARARALAANLVVANHSLVFAEMSAELPVSLPEHSQLIFDEAHNLEEAATTHFTMELSMQAVLVVTRRLIYVRGKARRGVLPSLVKRLGSGAVKAGEKNDEALILAGRAANDVIALGGMAGDLCRALGKVVGSKGQTLRYSFEESSEQPGKVPDQNPLWREADSRSKEFSEAIDKTVRSLKDLASLLDDSAAEGELNLASGDAADIKAAIGRLEELKETAEFIVNGCDAEYVYWLEKGRGTGQDYAAAYAAPVNVGRYLAEQVYAKKSSVVFCSATMSVANSFNFMESRLGLDLIDRNRLTVCRAPSPFDYVRQSALIVPEYMPPPDAADCSFTALLSDLVLRAAAHYGGRTMVLFTSYEMMHQCAENVRSACDKGGYQLLVQGESGSRNRMTRVFRQDGRSILFGTQSFWEGVDVMGEALSCVIVARLPFPSPGDPVVSARCERIDADGGNSFMHYSVPLAVLKLRQGFGRLIRHRLDRGSVVIADTRIVTKGYGGTFLRSLPVGAKRCKTADEVVAAMK